MDDRCSVERSEGRHWWIEVRPRVDSGRPIHVDPMTGVLVYGDDGEPVFDFPYTMPAVEQEKCHWCGRTRAAATGNAIELES